MDWKHYDESHADVQVGTGVTEAFLDHFLDMDTIQHPRFCRNPHDETKLEIHLSILSALDGPNHGLGELVAHVASHGDDSRHAHAHHGRCQNKGPSRTDETAHQAAYETDKKKIDDVG
ncbi:MAG: hypothetical protein FD153_2085 [Rhodospirillaceae bacterium]|nr:MAG: hypothetical protein FD153_2085 [Rhodospirillaceae bacterium]